MILCENKKQLCQKLILYNEAPGKKPNSCTIGKTIQYSLHPLQDIKIPTTEANLSNCCVWLKPLKYYIQHEFIRIIYKKYHGYNQSQVCPGL